MSFARKTFSYNDHILESPMPLPLSRIESSIKLDFEVHASLLSTEDEEDKTNPKQCKNGALEDIKSPSITVPTCNDLKSIVERSSPIPNSYSQFLVDTYSTFSFLKEAKLQPLSEGEVYKRMQNIYQKSSKVGTYLIREKDNCL